MGLGLLLPASLLAPHGSRTTFAAFLGVAMCVSAIPVIAKTLLDMNLLHRDIGQLTLTAGMLDDAVGWLLLSVVTAMATTGVSGAGVLRSVLSLAVVLLLAVVAGRLLVGPVYRWAERTGEVARWSAPRRC